MTHSDDLHFKAFVDLLQKPEWEINGGQPIDRDFFDRNIAGRHNPEIAAQLFPHKSAEDQTEFSEVKEAYFRKLASSELTPIPGLLELLSVVDSQSLRKIAVTNAPPKNVELMLDAIGLSGYFEEVVFGEHCARPKPFPDPYQLGLEKIGLTPDCTLVFEDSPAGIKAGVAAGIPVIAIATTQDPSRLVDAGASIVINDYNDVLELIGRRESAGDAVDRKSVV